MNIRQALIKSFFIAGDYKVNISKVTIETVVPRFQQLENFLGGDKEFFLGYLTWTDFIFAFSAEFFSAAIKSFGLECPLAVLPKLKALNGRVVSLPGVSARVQHSRSIPYMPPGVLPFNTTHYQNSILSKPNN